MAVGGVQQVSEILCKKLSVEYVRHHCSHQRLPPFVQDTCFTNPNAIEMHYALPGSHTPGT